MLNELGSLTLCLFLLYQIYVLFPKEKVSFWGKGLNYSLYDWENSVLVLKACILIRKALAAAPGQQVSFCLCSPDVLEFLTSKIFLVDGVQSGC